MVAWKNASTSVLALTVASLLSGETDGFASRVERRPCMLETGASLVRRRNNGRERYSATSTTLQATEQLVFGGDYCGVSDPLPAGTTKESAEAFLMEEQTQRIFFSAGGKNPCEPLEPTEDLVQMWSELTEYYGYERKPTIDDKMIKAKSSIKFPGLTLTTISASGVFVVENAESTLKEYHSFFVAEEQEVSGLPPSVFVYNRLTGNSEKEKGKFYPGSGKARSVISVVENQDGSLSFSFDVKLTITVSFPRALMKILPMSKSKMEQQSGQSISKALSGDVDNAIAAAAKSYEATSTS